MARTRNIDAVIDTAHTYGVYIEWCIDDWTYIKEEWDDALDKHYTHNQYITNDRDGRPGPCSTVDEFWDGVNGAREIYKRKLRYWMARWGWASNLMCFEMVNENGGSYKAKNWLLDMAKIPAWGRFCGAGLLGDHTGLRCLSEMRQRVQLGNQAL